MNKRMVNLHPAVLPARIERRSGMARLGISLAWFLALVLVFFLGVLVGQVIMAAVLK